MKPESVKLAVAVKVGPREEEFLRSALYEVDMSNMDLIKITCKKTGKIAYTTKANVAYWTMPEGVAVAKKQQPKGKANEESKENSSKAAKASKPAAKPNTNKSLPRL